MENVFASERKEIGRGRQSIVYEWRGYAYKVFQGPRLYERAEYEIYIQEQILKTSLNIPRVYPSEFVGTIKMDYIKGISLGEKMLTQHSMTEGIESLLKIQKQIHDIKDINLPELKARVNGQIMKADISFQDKNKATNCLSEMKNGNVLCHMDFHPYNIIENKDTFYIIDWANASIGNPVFDYARTYVILNEYDKELSCYYQKLLIRDSLIENADFENAVRLMSLVRKKENTAGNTKT